MEGSYQGHRTQFAFVRRASTMPYQYAVAYCGLLLETGGDSETVWRKGFAKADGTAHAPSPLDMP
jgi:hypothetical protein